jgi:pimeloyl-ACP methyl ester carboxylesterase
MVAQAYAALHPERIAALILCDTAVCDIGAIEATETINELYVPIVVR